MSASPSGPADDPAFLPAWHRALNALPDATIAAWFAVLWFAPLAFGPGAVGNALLVMLVEFLVVHGSGFLGVAALATDTSRRRKLALIGGFTLFYLLFVSAFAFSFGEWWPFLAFGWLALGKVLVVIDQRAPGPVRQQRMMTGWALSALAYVLGAFATVMLPLPRLGLNPGVVSDLGLPGGGLWVDQPHTVMAFGTGYFAVLALSKWRDWRFPMSHFPASRRPGPGAPR